MAAFHDGELAVQARAGVSHMAKRIGNSIHPTIPAAAEEFLAEQRLLVASSVDAQGRVWASPLTGAPGFVTVRDAETVFIAPAHNDLPTLVPNLRENPAAGFVAIEFATRRRMRFNGQAAVDAAGNIGVKLQEVFANCPKYIQARVIRDNDSAAAPHDEMHRSTTLTESQQRLVSHADTFFIASYNPESGADASHRGGASGFVHVTNPQLLAFPDYSGNNMFQTLGNLSIYPNAGLLFFDFDSGSTLQLSGTARIVWDADALQQFPGAQRIIEYTISEVRETVGANPLRWRFLNYSPFIPK